MTAITFASSFRFVVVAALLTVPGAIRQSAAQPAPGPSLSLTVNGTTQNVVPTWFAEDGVAYRLESSIDLATWSDCGPVIPGAGTAISFPQAMAGQSRFFFRVKRLSAEATFAEFDPVTGILTVIGDALDNAIVVGRDGAGILRINNGAAPISGGVPTVATTALIQVFGRAGHDQLSVDESNGPMPPANLSGEAGNDTMTGGSGNDVLIGGPGDDILLGKGGADSLFGGDNDDTLTGGAGDDQVFGEADNDRMFWNPGDDTDLNEGGGGIDTVEVNGGLGAEQFTTTANGARVRFDRLSPAPFSLDLGTSENLVLNANGGDDSFSATGNLAALIQLTVDGGPGHDTVLGSNGADVLLGGDGDDFLDGQQGSDVAFLGAGDDVFQWDPGDGSDTVEGQAGNDTLVFNGSNGAELFDAAANGARVRFTRNLGNIVLDLDDLENLEVNALGNADSLTVHDLAGTDLTHVQAGLAATLGGSAGDAQADTVLINGTPADDIITVTLAGDQLVVTGLAATVTVGGFETALDTVRVQGLSGDDILDASAVGTGGPTLALDGGSGDDILLGGAGSDSLFGGDNDDVLLGNGGVDLLDGGLGDNTAIQEGNNVTSGVLSVFGDALDNAITISRAADGAILSNGVPIPGATVANTALIRVFGLGGNDTVTLKEGRGGSLPAALLFGGGGGDVMSGGSASDLLFGGSNNDTLLGGRGFDLLFGGSGNDTLIGGDGDDQVFGEADGDRMVWNPGDDTDLNEGGGGIDTVEVNGGLGAEQFTTTANGARVRFDRLSPAPFSLDLGTSENLVLNANGGDDSFSATGNLAALIQLTVDGGPGHDTVLGSNGADVLLGGDGDDFLDGQQGSDVAFLGAGDDVFQWDPGDGSDTVEGQAGNDTLVFNGSNGAELFDAAANGARVRFTRNLGNIVLDLDDLENLEVNALGNADSLTVHDLAGTDLTHVQAGLAATLGGSAGDTQADTVLINGTPADDIVTVTLAGDELVVTGLAATVTVGGFETALDTVRVQGLSGDDILDASAVGTGGPTLALDGGSGDDILLGGAGSDSLFGGDNDDTLTGGAGDDQVFGEADNDWMVWNPGDDTDLNEGGGGIDTVEVNGGLGAEQFTTTANGARVRFDRLSPAPFSLDLGTSENLVLNANGGDDSFSATGNLAALIQLTVDGGPGHDTVLGSNGADVLLGGDGDDFLDGQQGSDVAFLGAGDDVFQWDPGDGSDTVEGQAGNDTLVFNGSNGAELFDAAANGARVRFTRNLGNIVLDLDDLEALEVNALGNADSLTVHDLAGTDLTHVQAGLAGTLGGNAGDAGADVITVNGTPAADTIHIGVRAGAVEVSGLAALVRITHPEAALDALFVNGLGGVDTITVDPDVITLIGVTANE